jgi:hypothetical protein
MRHMLMSMSCILMTKWRILMNMSRIRATKWHVLTCGRWPASRGCYGEGGQRRRKGRIP